MKSISESPPSPENLRRAYNHLSKPDWAGLEFELQHPVRGRVIRALALEYQRTRPTPQTVNPPKYDLPKPVEKKGRGSGNQPAWSSYKRKAFGTYIHLDQKSLASGEKPEPDTEPGDLS